MEPNYIPHQIYSEKWSEDLLSEEKDESEEDKVFLGPGLVSLISKITIACNLSLFNEFSLLDSMEIALNKCKSLMQNDFDEKKICLYLLNVMRITEKFNDANCAIQKSKLSQLFPFEIKEEEFPNFEFETYKTLDFKIASPKTLEFVDLIVQSCITEFLTNEKFFLELTADILRMVYSRKAEVYQTLSTVTIKNLNINKSLFLASSTVVASLKILDVPTDIYSQCLEAVSSRFQCFPEDLEKFAEIIVEISI